MTKRAKVIYLIVVIVVPFMIYTGYYYYEMIRKAPFKFEEFETFEVHFKTPRNRTTYVDFRSGVVDYRLADSILLQDTLSFSRDELQELHRTLYTNNFFDLPHEMRNTGEENAGRGLYTLQAVYQRKSYQVVYEPGYSGDRRWKDKTDRIITHIESRVRKKLESN